MMPRFARFCEGGADLISGLKLSRSTVLTAAVAAALGLSAALGCASEACAQATGPSGGQSQNNQDREGGIIGTGVTAYDLVQLEAGIYGTITALGSIYVNGHHIGIDDELAVRGSAVLTQAGDLQPGHPVAVVVRRSGDGADGYDWRAVDLRHVAPLVGPVDQRQAEAMTVLGTEVRLPAGVTAPEVGQWVAVSGLWQGDQVVASRVDVVADSAVTGQDRTAQISGSFDGLNSDGSFRIGQTLIRGLIPEHLKPGMRVRVLGTPVAGGLSAQTLEAGLFDGDVDVQHVEGYYSIPAPDGRYTVLGSGLIAYTTRPEMISTSDPVFRCGQAGALIGLAGAPEELTALFNGC
jgi:hypothetical protein